MNLTKPFTLGTLLLASSTSFAACDRASLNATIDSYFAALNGHAPGHLYDLVMREVEEPLFRAVLDYSAGNQSRAADILGINRGTLRKKLRVYGIAG